MKTIIVQAVQGKLRNARKEKLTVYLSGSLGMGKTTAAKYFYRNTPHVYLDGSNGKLLQMPEEEALADKVLIIDDISQIADIPSRQYILARVYDHKDQVVLIGRGKIPTWLAVADIEHSFFVIGNRDLEFTDENIRELYRSRYAHVPTDPDEFVEIVERSFRNPLYLSYMIDNSVHSEDSIGQIISEAEHSLFQYMEHKFYNQLRREVREALLQLAMVGKFNVSMAEIVTAHQQIRQVLEEMKQVGNFLANTDNDTFYIRHFYLNFLAWKESVVMSRRQRESVYERAALYYEMNENMERALFYYKKAEDTDEILHLLTKISEENPEMMNFTEIGPYLENLSVENIQNTPQLMCGMSMMHSLRMNPRKAEEWYEKLKNYADLCMPDSMERREADAMLRFLDIKLPHRSTDGLEEHLRNLTCYEAYYEHGGYRKASFSIGMPSALNGSLDLSDFVRGKVEREESVLDIAEPVAHLFESDIHSTLRLSLAEWKYERNELQGRELEKILNEIYITACAVGDMELAFAAIAILAKSFMSRGDMRSAMEFFDRFIIRTKSFRDRHMKACIDAYYARMLMRQGDVSFAGEWLSKSPNSTEFFTIRDRYLYIQKVRVLIMMERYQEALSLIERLELAFENYHRIILGIQNTCLKAILLFREGEENWENVLIQAMETAQQYGYIQLLADEGAAMKPLLDKLDQKKVRMAGIRADYLEQVIEKTNLATVYYPFYMRTVKELEEPLTDMEHKVIRLMCHEMNTEEICNLLHISTSALKFHKQNIYRKFGVKNRNEAQRKAKSLGLNLS